MSRTQRQLQRRELARRAFIKTAQAGTVLECDWGSYDEAGRTVRTPKPSRLLETWGQVANKGDSVVIFVPAGTLVPADVRRMAGVAVRVLTQADFDTLIPPHAASAAGHFSRAFTAEHATYDFASDYDPLSVDSGHWTALLNGNYIRASGGEGIFTVNAAAGTLSVYRFDDADMSGEGADYGVEADLTSGESDANRRYPHVDFRQAGKGRPIRHITTSPSTRSARTR